MSIPRKIHYCWLSGEKMPKEILASIKSWKRVMPDYEIILWDKNRFDINSVQWVAEACRVKKWAFAADYIRLYAVYTEGGLYFDSDVYAFKRVDDLLNHDFFTCLEYKNTTQIFKDVVNSDFDNIQKVGNITFEAGIFGGISGHPFLKDCMSWYENRHFIFPGGEYNTKVIAPDIYAAVAQGYGFRYIDEEQKLKNNMIIFPARTMFYSSTPHTVDELTGIYAVHWWAGSWRFNPVSKAIRKIKDNDCVRKLFGKRLKVTIEKIIKQTAHNWR